ncbi:ethanolamine-phosphate cytidylyltransferase-like protein [Tanacetum coccineum]
MEYHGYYSIWDGVYTPLLCGGILLQPPYFGFSKTYYTGIMGFLLCVHVPYLGSSEAKGVKKRVRVYMDGCFDLMHYGHANALRQAKALGDELVVGIVSDEEIIKNKGPPVLSMDERAFIFNMGMIPCYFRWKSDAYALAQESCVVKGRLKATEGVTRRILASMDDKEVSEVNGECNGMIRSMESHSISKHASNFLPTSRRIVQFANGKGPGPNARVVYIDGGFDLFHAGHVEILKNARQLGDFLLVGIYTDQTISVLLAVVDEVIIGARWGNSPKTWYCIYFVMNHFLVLVSFAINLNGLTGIHDNAARLQLSISVVILQDSQDGILGHRSPKNITTTSVAQRIKANHEIYQKRNAKKEASEKKFYEERKACHDPALIESGDLNAIVEQSGCFLSVAQGFVMELERRGPSILIPHCGPTTCGQTRLQEVGCPSHHFTIWDHDTQIDYMLVRKGDLRLCKDCKENTISSDISSQIQKEKGLRIVRFIKDKMEELVNKRIKRRLKKDISPFSVHGQRSGTRTRRRDSICGNPQTIANAEESNHTELNEPSEDGKNKARPEGSPHLKTEVPWRRRGVVADNHLQQDCS